MDYSSDKTDSDSLGSSGDKNNADSDGDNNPHNNQGDKHEAEHDKECEKYSACSICSYAYIYICAYVNTWLALGIYMVYF